MSGTDFGPKQVNQPSAPQFARGGVVKPVFQLHASPPFDDLIVAIGEGLAVLLNALGEDEENAYGEAMTLAADRLVLLCTKVRR